MSTALKYTVQSGDTLSGIADNINSSAGVTYQQIEAANPGIDPNQLQVGQSINIPETTSSGTWTYVVQPGDSYSKIASDINDCTGVTYQDIEAANPGVNPSNLQVGEVLNIPAQNVAPPPPIVPADNIGYWDWTWSPTTAVPGATMGMAFSGWADVSKAIQDSKAVINQLAGEKYISIGGGGETTGKFTSAVLDDVNAAINNGSFAGYDGIAYDIEVGDAGLASDFSVSFAAAKAKGFKVLVTVSHSAPYAVPDAADLMKALIADSNIDFMSPQLYTQGNETKNDYADPLLPWSAYKDCKSVMIPSIVKADLYPSAVTYFEGQGITLKGYIQWAKTS